MELSTLFDLNNPNVQLTFNALLGFMGGGGIVWYNALKGHKERKMAMAQKELELSEQAQVALWERQEKHIQKLELKIVTMDARQDMNEQWRAIAIDNYLSHKQKIHDINNQAHVIYAAGKLGMDIPDKLPQLPPMETPRIGGTPG